MLIPGPAGGQKLSLSDEILRLALPCLHPCRRGACAYPLIHCVDTLSSSLCRKAPGEAMPSPPSTSFCSTEQLEKWHLKDSPAIFKWPSASRPGLAGSNRPKECHSRGVTPRQLRMPNPDPDCCSRATGNVAGRCQEEKECLLYILA